jgi:hypothetical protein
MVVFGKYFEVALVTGIKKSPFGGLCSFSVLLPHFEKHI